MDKQIEKFTGQSATESFNSELYKFNVILKFWKKSSKSFEANILGINCVNQEAFVKHIREAYEIKSSHCLEEIWVLQKSNPIDRKIQWIKDISGRIKIHVPDSYKDFLLRKSETKGKKLFEDPSYEQ